MSSKSMCGETVNLDAAPSSTSAAPCVGRELAARLHGWQGCAITEHPDGSATVVLRLEQGDQQIHLAPHVWRDLAFEVERATGFAARRQQALHNMSRSRRQAMA